MKPWPTEYTHSITVGLFTYDITCTHDKGNTPTGIQDISILAHHPSSPHQPIACLSGQIAKATSLYSILYTGPDRNDIHRCLRALFTHKFQLREEIVTHARCRGTGVWGHEIERTDLGFVEGIWTDIGYRKRGVGKQMVEILRKVVGYHDVKYIIMLPSWLNSVDSWRSDADPEWRPWDDDGPHDTDISIGRAGFCQWNRNFVSYHDVGIDGSKAFWRACGARRIGLKPWFGIAIDGSHPASQLPASQDVEDMHCRDRWRRAPFVCIKNEPHDVKVCEKEARKPTISAQITAAMNRKTDLEIPDLLYDIMRPLHRVPMLAEVRRSYAYYPLVHIAIDHGKTRTLWWFIRFLPTLVENETNFDGYTAREALQLSMDMAEERRAYGEEDYGCNERENTMMMEMLLENRDNLRSMATPPRSVFR